MPDFRAGDVLRYWPRRHHCKEGTAVVREDGRILDTYWNVDGDPEYGTLNDDEISTAEVQFNLNDYEALDRWSPASRGRWEEHHPDDRGRIPSQHGLREALFLRRGSSPCIDTQIENARVALDTAEQEMRSAERRVEWRREDLAKLEAARDGSLAAASEREGS